jgi:threonine/homoserine/homoserine lactone efflux protein
MHIDWPAFLAVVLLAYVVPGPDFAVIVRASAEGARHGLAAAAGAQTGLFAHMAAAVCGLSVLLAGSPAALRAIQLTGAAYLAYLGARALWASRRVGGTGETDPHHTPAAPRRWYTQGLATNLTNPKAILFFASILPQFVDADGDPAAQVLLLGVVDVAIGLAVWAAWVGVASRLARALRRPRVRRRWERATGTTFIGLAVLLAARR